jgi:D-alanine-D-alanine ligase
MGSVASWGGDAVRVAVLAGGRSSEHDVSLASAEAVQMGLRAGGHEVVWVEIDRAGAWRSEGEPLRIAPGEGLLGADVAFPVLHGPFGEDGTVQGVLEALDVAYVGAGVTASAVCMNKVLFKELMKAAGVPQVDYRGVRAERWRRAPPEVLGELEQLGLPVFVKPAHLGSSVGIVKVTQAEDMQAALTQALAHDELAIVEAMAPGLEVECGVLGRSQAEGTSGAALGRSQAEGTSGAALGRSQAERTTAAALDRGTDSMGAADTADPAGPALASEPGEIVLPSGREWYDYEAKYTSGGMELMIPARISAGARDRVMELAVETFARTGCAGLARVDFFVDGEEVLVNELNTMPGFTPTSVYAKLMQASGVAYPELVERLCRLGIERHEARRAYSY